MSVLISLTCFGIWSIGYWGNYCIGNGVIINLLAYHYYASIHLPITLFYRALRPFEQVE